MTSDRPRPPKKSEMLEVRLPHQTKQDFVAACQRAGRTVSDVLREAVQDFIDADRKRPDPQTGKLLAMIPNTIRKRRYIAGAAAAFALGAAVLLPSTAAADPDFSAAFALLDVNKDGKLDLAEFTPQPFNDSGFFREARINDVKGLPHDVVWVLPTTTQKDVTARSALGELTPGYGDDFRRFDANGDKSVDVNEFSAAIASMIRPVFDARDANKDGKLSRAEIDAPVSITANLAISSVATPPGEDVLKPGPLPRVAGLDAFTAYDRNKDGVVTFDEYVPQP